MHIYSTIFEYRDFTRSGGSSTKADECVVLEQVENRILTSVESFVRKWGLCDLRLSIRILTYSGVEIMGIGGRLCYQGIFVTAHTAQGEMKLGDDGKWR